MKKLIFVCLLFFANVTFSQNAELISLINKADSVILLSHKSTSDGGIEFFDTLGNPIKSPDLLADSLVNYKILIKKISLSKEQKIRLNNCFQLKDKTSTVSGCYFPHHSILIYLNHNLTLIDLCFECNGNELKLGKVKYHLINENYTKLNKFFNELNLIELDNNYDN